MLKASGKILVMRMSSLGDLILIIPLLKSLREVGDEVRAHSRAATDQKASLQEIPNR